MSKVTSEDRESVRREAGAVSVLRSAGLGWWRGEKLGDACPVLPEAYLLSFNVFLRDRRRQTLLLWQMQK